MIYMKKLEIRLDNKLMYKKLKEAEIEMKIVLKDILQMN